MYDKGLDANRLEPNLLFCIEWQICNLFSTIDSLTRQRTEFPFWYASSRDVPSTNSLVSCANRIKRPRSEQLDMSFMKRKNNRRPSTEPCGTPKRTVRGSDFFSISYSVGMIAFDETVSITSYYMPV